ncbi:MAG TPA: hypothetical protein VGN16_25800, partial [Acidobacteriaceae bacterium]
AHECVSNIEMLHIGTVAISTVALQEFVLKRPGSDPKRYVDRLHRDRFWPSGLPPLKIGNIPFCRLFPAQTATCNATSF